MKMEREKLYMVCDYTDDKAASILGCPDIGVEHLGHCSGRLLKEDGTIIGEHHSSTFDFLRYDLCRKVINPEQYELIDLIGQPVPDRFKQGGTQKGLDSEG
jgi:hypothetical protein